jgi:hypothetical protein
MTTIQNTPFAMDISVEVCLVQDPGIKFSPLQQHPGDWIKNKHNYTSKFIFYD